MNNILGHVKWFTTGVGASDVPSTSTTEWFWVAAGVAAGITLLVLIDRLLKKRKLESRLDDRLGKYRPIVGTTVRISTGLLIIVNFLSGDLFAPNIVNQGSFTHQVISLSLLAIGVALIIGVYSRLAGASLVVVYLLSLIFLDGRVDLLDHLVYLGLGLYLGLAGGGKFRLASDLKDPLDGLTKFSYLALPALRIFTGLSLIVLAFSEKLLDMPRAVEFLYQHDWNFLSALDVSDRAFVLLAAAVEATLGLSLLLNKAVRLSSLLLLLVMTITAILLGSQELLGHLAFTGLVLGVWIGTSGKT